MKLITAILLTIVISAWTGEPAPKLTIHNIKSSSLSEGKITSFKQKLSQEILNAGLYSILEREDLDALMAEQMLKESEITETNDEDEADAKEATPISADFMLSGSVEDIGGGFLMTLKIVEVKSGIIKKAVSEDFKGSFRKLLSKGVKGIVKQLAPEPGKKSD